jgi:hypothetical protein
MLLRSPPKRSWRPSSSDVHVSSAPCIASRPNAARVRSAAALAASVRPSAIPRWNAKPPHAIFALGCAIARQLKGNLVFASTCRRSGNVHWRSVRRDIRFQADQPRIRGRLSPAPAPILGAPGNKRDSHAMTILALCSAFRPHPTASDPRSSSPSDAC